MRTRTRRLVVGTAAGLTLALASPLVPAANAHGTQHGGPEKGCHGWHSTTNPAEWPARKALRVLEERSLLEDLLSRTVLNSGVDDVQILIGGEGTWQELRDCSVVLARYGAPGLVTGALGVLGPTRMAYGRTVSAVRFVSGLLSDLVVDSLAE